MAQKNQISNWEHNKLFILKVPNLGFEISSWKKVKLNDIVQFLQGLTYSPDNISEEGTIVLRSSNIQNSTIDLCDIVKVNCYIPEKLKITLIDDKHTMETLVSRITLNARTIVFK